MKLNMATTLMCAGLLSVTATAANAAATQELNVTGNILAETCTFKNSGTVALGDRGTSAFGVNTNVFDLANCPANVTLGLVFSGTTGELPEFLANSGTSVNATLKWYGNAEDEPGPLVSAKWDGSEVFPVRTSAAGEVAIEGQRIEVASFSSGASGDLEPGTLMFQGTATVVYP